jgi:hypothetical protein
MNSEVLQTFQQRMLPLYTPQSEKLLESLDARQLQHVAFRYIFATEAMLKVSRMIENRVIAGNGPTDLHVSLQQMSHVASQKERYQQVVASAKGVWIYGEAGRDRLDILEQANVRLVETGNTLVTRYWFVVAYGAGTGMSLLAEQVSALVGDDRYYEGFYTFEPEVAYQIVSILHQVFPDLVPLPTSPDEK